jgi:hypothetical protein
MTRIRSQTQSARSPKTPVALEKGDKREMRTTVPMAMARVPTSVKRQPAILRPVEGCDMELLLSRHKGGPARPAYYTIGSQIEAKLP